MSNKRAAPGNVPTSRQGEQEQQQQEQPPLADAMLHDAHTLDELLAALRAGADPDSRTEYNRTKLMDACYRDDITMARELLAAGAQPDARDADGVTVIHFAAMGGSAELMALLIATGVPVDQRLMGHNGESALFHAVVRNDPEAVGVAQCLLDAGADPNAARIQRTAHSATGTVFVHCAFKGTTAMLELLLRYGANPRTINAGTGMTPLLVACANHIYGAEMIPILTAAGALDTCCAQGLSLVQHAYANGNASIMAAARRIVGPGDVARYKPSSVDPVGVVREYHYPDRTQRYYHNILPCAGQGDHRAKWASLRIASGPVCDEGTPARDTFALIAKSNDPHLWKLCANEMCSFQNWQTGNTLLHEAVGINSIAGVRAICKQVTVNPLLRNKHDATALDLCTDATMRAELVQYMAWRPLKEWARWYGPYVTMWQYYFLLVCQRWRCPIDRNVRIIIMRYIADPEQS